jgi:hypothetical protein
MELIRAAGVPILSWADTLDAGPEQALNLRVFHSLSTTSCSCQTRTGYGMPTAASRRPGGRSVRDRRRHRVGSRSWRPTSRWTTSGRATRCPAPAHRLARPGGLRSTAPGGPRPCRDEIGIPRPASVKEVVRRALPQLGTLGGGTTSSRSAGPDGHVVVMLHSGSRPAAICDCTTDGRRGVHSPTSALSSRAAYSRTTAGPPRLPAAMRRARFAR